MLGIFDSGFGGLTILRELVRQLPQYSYIYLADSARAPYGNRTAEEIYEFTRQGVEYLFKQGCGLVILGCNTASATALRRIQQELVTQHYPDKRVLGILVPTIEQITGVNWNAHKSLIRPLDDQPDVLGVLATELTVQSGAYEREIHKRSPTIKVIQQACPELVPLIEAGASRQEIQRVAKQYTDSLLEKARAAAPHGQIAILLGCTHYALVAHYIAELLPPAVHLYEQPVIVAKSLHEYLERHQELASRLVRENQQTFLTTGDPEQSSKLGSQFFGKEIRFEKVKLAVD